MDQSLSMSTCSSLKLCNHVGRVPCRDVYRLSLSLLSLVRVGSLLFDDVNGIDIGHELHRQGK